MITAIVIDESQIERMKEHMENCQELGAKGAIIYLASEDQEVSDLNRMYEEWSQGDPPMGMRQPHVIYAGPNWVVGISQDVSQILDILEKE